ncbi:NACHT domain-containing protein [Verrucosispora sp. ts21]|uniref:NACHT domain-containing protein n=1 Tax=Verrucosispora sp. ts21 TaxID=2069341 RepID=UPI001304CF44|nr:NACHT domain-containing protein [Verrucosispora sp. ts21]
MLGLGLLLNRRGLDFADKFGSAASLLVALFALSLPLLSASVGRMRGVHPPSDLTAEEACDELARALVHRLSDNARWRRVYDPWPLPVSWTDERSGRRHEFDEIADCFRALPDRRLIILGAAGSGKSVIAQKLARDLLTQRVAGGLVPVVVPATTWRPDRSMTGWIEATLLSVLPELAARPVRAIGIDTVAGMIARSGVIPIVDGLDELPEGIRAEVIESINRHGSDQPLVLTSRPEEFAEAVSAAGRPLSRSAMLTLRPLRLSDARRYLRESTAGHPDRWTPLFVAARSSEPLATVLTNPLSLWLMRTVYEQGDSQPSSLLAIPQTVEALENRLFEHFLPSVYHPIGAKPPRWRSDRAGRWLGAQARWMHWEASGKARQELRWWELAAWNASGLAGAARVVRAAVKGTLGALTLTWAADLYRERPDVVTGAIRDTLSDGLLGQRALPTLTEAAVALAPVFDTVALFPQRPVNVIVLATVATTVFFLRSQGYPALPAAPTWDPRPWLTRALRHAVVASVLFYVGFQAVGLLDGGFSPVDGALVWSVLAVAVLAAGVTRPRLFTVGQASEPKDSVLADRRATLTAGLARLLLLAVTFGVLAGLRAAVMLGVVGAALLVTRLLFGSRRAHATAYETYAEARLGSWLAGWGPWDMIGFLEDAHVRGVLRQSGATYEFRHVRLLEHLAGEQSPIERMLRSIGLIDWVQQRYPRFVRLLAPLGRRVDTRAAAAGVEAVGDLTRRFSDDVAFVPQDERPDLPAVAMRTARIVVDERGRLVGRLPNGRLIAAATLRLPLGLGRARRYLRDHAEPVSWPSGETIADGIPGLEDIRFPVDMPAVPALVARPGEIVTRVFRRHPVTTLMPIVFGLVAVVATTTLIDVSAGGVETLIWALFALWSAFRIAGHYDEKYVLTDRRLVYRSGFLIQRIRETPISSIIGCVAYQGPIGLALNYGDVFLDKRRENLQAALETSILGRILNYSTWLYWPEDRDGILQVGQPLDVFIALRDAARNVATGSDRA